MFNHKGRKEGAKVAEYFYVGDRHACPLQAFYLIYTFNQS